MALTKKLTERMTDYKNPKSIGVKFRTRRIRPLIEMVKNVYERYGCVNIIDIGGTKTYWQIIPQQVLRDNNVTITIVNLPGTDLPANEQHYKFVQGDGCDLSIYKDNSFHIAHSNSVIEHVGDWQQMVKFAHEARRLAPNIFIQVPYFWFPVEPHFMTPFFHWFPKPVRVSLVMRFHLGQYERSKNVDEAMRSVESARLLDVKMFQELFPDAMINREKIGWLTKSLIAIRKE